MADIVPSPEIRTREEFGLLANARGLLRGAVEVGTDRGGWAHDFLASWKGHCLFCVDPYLPYGHMPWDREADMLLAIGYLSKFAARARIVRHSSLEAAQKLRSYAVDFVYIDGDHRYEPTKLDIELWWDLLDAKGILAGHDFDDDHHEVKRAVLEFSEAHKLTIYHTRDAYTPPSWYVYKTHPGELCQISQ